MTKPNIQVCVKCGYLNKHCRCREPKTNADRIRAMGDEELEAYIVHSGFCPSGTKREPCMYPDSDIECSECIQKWLQLKA